MQLILQLARLGDLLQTGRLVQSVLRRGETWLCVDTSLVEVAKLAFPAVTVRGVDLSATGMAANVRLFAELSSAGFHSIYNLNHAGLNRALARLFPPDRVRGYRVSNGQSERDVWLRLAARWTANRRASPVNLVDLWGFLDDDPVPPHSVHPEAVPRAGVLGVALAGRHARRSLSPALLAPAVQVLYEQQSAMGGNPEIWLLGGKSERALGRELMNLLSPTVLNRTVNMAGRTSLPEIFARVGELGCLLTPDTGLMHMAAHHGVPVQGLFLSSAWAWETGPYGLGHTVWQGHLPCAPCLEAASCGAGVLCARAFGREWLRVLSGKSSHANASVTGDAPPLRLKSGLDEFGLIWHGSPPDDLRTAQRTLAAETRGVVLPGAVDPAATRMATDLYTEAEWMLPGPGRVPGECS